MSYTNDFQIFSKQQQASLFRGGSILRDCLTYLRTCVKPGISTKKLDELAEEFILSKGGKPAFKGYQGFTGTLCTSINDEVVHGIPSSKKILQEGDIISLDCGVIMDDLYTDSCITVAVGKIDAKVQHFLDVTSQTLEDVITIIKAGIHIGDISSFIEKSITKHGYGVVRMLTGHGLGDTLHQFPDVPNVGKPGTGPVLPVGTMIAIEPIVTIGSPEVFTEDDGWTISTKDHSFACHYEHSVLITESGCKVVA